MSILQQTRLSSGGDDDVAEEQKRGGKDGRAVLDEVVDAATAREAVEQEIRGRGTTSTSLYF